MFADPDLIAGFPECGALKMIGCLPLLELPTSTL